MRAQSVAGARFGEGEGEVEKQPAVYRYASLSSLRYCLLKSLNSDILTKRHLGVFNESQCCTGRGAQGSKKIGAMGS